MKSMSYLYLQYLKQIFNTPSSNKKTLCIYIYSLEDVHWLNVITENT